jgi:hypothetical protein
MTTERIDRVGLRGILLIFGLTAGLAAWAPVADQQPMRPRRPAARPKQVPVTINWAMSERFGPGYDRNRDGRPDLPNSYQYVNPGRYEVQLAACVDTVGLTMAGMSCTWTIDGRDEAIQFRTPGPQAMVRLPEGTYSVTVTVQLPDGRTGSARETIRVKDIARHWVPGRSFRPSSMSFTLAP